jgi:mono/diheme cytochrome c family protein
MERMFLRKDKPATFWVDFAFIVKVALQKSVGGWPLLVSEFGRRSGQTQKVIFCYYNIMHKLILITALIAICFAFANIVQPFHEDKPVYIPAEKQRTGDAQKGYKYLTTGDYVKGGIPYDFFLLGAGTQKTNHLGRIGLNANVRHDFTVVKAANGENIVAPNCLQCHAQVFNDSLYIGMGNTFIDFSNNDKSAIGKLLLLENFLKSSSPAKYEAAKSFIQTTKTIGPYLNTPVRGVNTAGRLAYMLFAHRDPVTFRWMDKPSLEIPDEVIPSDVPAWWLLKKKNAMFYTGFGRGDFGRFLMVSNLLTVNDTAEAREVDNNISDVLAYINTLQPPPYPHAVNEPLAEEGKAIFIDKCSKCHGKYGDQSEYPNLLIPASIIKTDSLLYKSNYQHPQFVKWFNKSWFATGDHPARLAPYEGYIAPPLDGVWATAPYLHNGSVPTIEGVLNSKARPKYWSRNYNQPVYDFEKVGWQYQAETQPGNTTVYNTDLPGYGNYGHYFGDKLSDQQRKAVIEYLKKL